MALLDALKKAKKKVDDFIPDFNIKKNVGNVAKGTVNFVKDIPKEVIAGTIRSVPIAADTGARVMEGAYKSLLPENQKRIYEQRMERARNQIREKQASIKELELKKDQPIRNYLKDSYNRAVPELKTFQDATKTQRAGALIDIGTSLIPGGSQAKSLAKPTLATTLKTLRKPAITGAIGGASGKATERNATTKDIVMGGLGGAILGTGIKGAGIVVPKVASKIGRDIKLGFEQPTFKPAFASTDLKRKPKLNLKVMTEEEFLSSKGAPFMKGEEPAITVNIKQDRNRAKRIQEVQKAMSENNSRRELLRKEYAEKVKSGEIRPPTRVEELIKTANGHEDNPSVQAARRLLEKRKVDWRPKPFKSETKIKTPAIKLQSKVETPNISRLPELPSAKAPEQLAKEVLSKNIQAPVISKIPEVNTSVNKVDIKQPQPNIEGFTPFGEPKTIQARKIENNIDRFKVKESKVSELDKINLLADKYKVDKRDLFGFVKNNKFSLDEVENSFARNSDKPNVRNKLGVAYEDITRRRQTPNIDKVLTREDLSTPLQKPKTQPIKMVSQKDEIRPEPKLSSQEVPQSNINEAINFSKNKSIREAKTPIDYNKLTEEAVNVKDDITKKNIVEYVEKKTQDIVNRYIKKTGKKGEFLTDEIDNRTYDSKTKELYKEVADLFNTGNKINEIRNKQITGYIEGYIRHISPENLEKIRTEGSKKNVGDVLYSAGFGKKRTGALKEYSKDLPKIMASYFDEAIGPIDKVKNDFIKTANTIKNEISGKSITKDGVIDKGDKNINYSQIIKENFKPEEAPVKRYEPLKGDWLGILSRPLRSVKDIADEFASKEFRKDFLNPFLEAESKYNSAITKAEKMSDEQLQKTAKLLDVYIGDKFNRNQTLLNISAKLKQKFNTPATEKFIENVSKANISDSRSIDLINDIAEVYIGQQSRGLTNLEKLTGTVRLQYARGALGLNIGSSIQNVLELKKVLSRVGPKNFAGAIKDYALGKDLRDKYSISSTSKILESESFDILKKIDPVLFSLFDFTENYKDRVLLSGLERQAKSRGLKGEDLTDYVNSNFQKYAIKFGKGDDIGIFRNQIAKTALQFLQYPIKDTTSFVDASIKGVKGIIKDKKANDELGYALGYLTTSFLQMALLSQVIGQKGFGDQTGFTPYDFINGIVSKAKDGTVPKGPGLTLIEDMFNYVKAINQPESETKEDDIQSKVNKIKENLYLLIPARGQYKKTMDYNKNFQRGYFESKKGNIANLVSEDPWGIVRAYIFGGSYDPERQDYFKRGFTGLDEEQSALVRSQLEESKLTEDKNIINSTKDNIKNLYKYATTSKKDYFNSLEEASKDLSPEDKLVWDSLKDNKADSLAEDMFNDNKRMEKYKVAEAYTRNPKVLEAARKNNQLQVEKGYPSNPLFELPTPLLTKVLLKDALPPGSKDPELSKLRDEEWYQDYSIAKSKYYEQVKANMEKSGKKMPEPTNPYPETPELLQAAMDEYFSLPSGTKDKSNWRKANPGIWQNMLAQWAQVDAWENKERVAIGLAEINNEKTEAGSGYSKSGGKKSSGKSGGSSKTKNPKAIPIKSQKYFARGDKRMKDVLDVDKLLKDAQRLANTQKIKGDINYLKLKTSPIKKAITLQRKQQNPAIKLVKSKTTTPKKLTIKKISVK